MNDNREQPTTPSERRIQRAAAVLRQAGWTALPPAPLRSSDMRDQCEYPDRHGSPGDCCTNLTGRKRATRHGAMWLCDAHFHAPETMLFDERLACHAD